MKISTFTILLSIIVLASSCSSNPDEFENWEDFSESFQEAEEPQPLIEEQSRKMFSFGSPKLTIDCFYDFTPIMAPEHVIPLVDTFELYVARDDDGTHAIEITVNSVRYSDNMEFDPKTGLNSAINTLSANPEISNFEASEPVDLHIGEVSGKQVKAVASQTNGIQANVDVIYLFEKETRTIWQMFIQHTEKYHKASSDIINSIRFE